MHLSRIIRFAAWACVALVAVLSLTPSAHIERTSLGGQVEHLIAYAIAGAMLTVGYQGISPIALLVAYAGLLEYLQQFSPGRTSQARDFAFSTIGCVLGLAAGWMLNRTISKLRGKRS